MTIDNMIKGNYYYLVSIQNIKWWFLFNRIEKGIIISDEFAYIGGYGSKSLALKPNKFS